MLRILFILARSLWLRILGMNKHRFARILNTVMLALMISVVDLLAGCTQAQYTEGASSIEIKYRSAVPFERSPVFTETDGVIRMSFNGNEWYTAEIITAEERDLLIKDREVLAETSNMRVYDTSDDTADPYSYTYIFEPAPDSGYCIRFDTDAAPEGHDLAKDFTTSIQYFVDGTEVVPEIPGD